MSAHQDIETQLAAYNSENTKFVAGNAAEVLVPVRHWVN
jgi:hypothetical protein